MAVPNNILQVVQTYQMSGLAYLQNLCCFLTQSNKKYKDFDKLPASLGDTVTFDKPPRMTTVNSLVAQFQPADQRVQSLTVDQQISTSYAFTDQQFIFQVRDYMEKFGMSAVQEIGTKVESNIAANCVSNTYRFYGDGITPINSYTQLASALALFRNYGSANGTAKGFISDIAVPGVVSSGLNQFAMDRNNKIANSWELGHFSNCDWYQSNLLPVHYSGTEGNVGSTLTVVSFTQNGPQNSIDTITFSGASAANDANSVKQYDKFVFQDGVANQTNLRFLTFIGHLPSSNPVQFQALANATSSGGQQVTVTINPPLQIAPTNNQNLNTPIVAGQQVKVMPSHRAGVIYAGDPLFLAMPQLPTETPYPTGNKVDPETGASIRQYYGSLFGQNLRGMIHDAIWGSTLVDEYSMALLFPL